MTRTVLAPRIDDVGFARAAGEPPAGFGQSISYERLDLGAPGGEGLTR